MRRLSFYQTRKIIEEFTQSIVFHLAILAYKWGGLVGPPNKKLLKAIRYGWGNNAYSADEQYLEEVLIKGISTKGVILECGTGLTTILLGLICEKTQATLYSLENNYDWSAHVKKYLNRLKLNQVHVQLAPIKKFGEFDWYNFDETAMPSEIDLVVCDGPPASTVGGRYGLMPLLGDRIAIGGIILVDDVNREDERLAIDKWGKNRNFNIEWRGTERRGFAILTCV